MINSTDALDRYLDRLAREEIPDASDLDPELTATDRAFREIGDVPGPDRTFVDRLEESLMDAVTVSPRQLAATPSKRQSSEPQAPTRRVPTNLPPRGAGRWASFLLIAAMVVAALGVVTNPLRPVRDWLDDRNDLGGFVIQAPGTPAPEFEETVLTLTLPDAVIPRGDGVSAGLAHFSIPPGTRSTWVPRCCPGPMVEYVMAGTYSVTAEAAITIIRADGAEEAIAANTEVVLGPGDALVGRNEMGLEAANTGDVPVELLNWVLIDNTGFGGHVLPGWESHRADVRSSVSLAPGAVEWSLRRIDLKPGAVVPAAPPGTLTFVVTLPENALGTPVSAAGRNAAGEVRSAGGQAVVVYVLTLVPTGTGSGTPGSGTIAPGTPVAGTPSP